MKVNDHLNADLRVVPAPLEEALLDRVTGGTVTPEMREVTNALLDRVMDRFLTRFPAFTPGAAMTADQLRVWQEIYREEYFALPAHERALVDQYIEEQN